MIWQRIEIPPMPDETPFGTHVVLDIKGCNVAAISDAGVLEEWVTSLVDLLKMKPYGEPRIPFFGHASPVTSGHSVDQLIETSNVMAHLSPYLATGYFDVFSCSEFDPEEAAAHTVTWLGGTHGRMIVIDR